MGANSRQFVDKKRISRSGPKSSKLMDGGFISPRTKKHPSIVKTIHQCCAEKTLYFQARIGFSPKNFLDENRVSSPNIG